MIESLPQLGLSPLAVVLIGTAFLGMNCGVVGGFAVLRGRALLGDAIAHAALPGICLSYLIVQDRQFGAFLLGALLFGLAVAAVIVFVRTQTRVKEDAAIGLSIGCFFGLGIVLSRIIQNEPSGNRAGLDGFIFGKAASMVQSDAAAILFISLASLVGVMLLYKELKLLCFDRDFAAATGKPAVFFDLSLMALISVATVSGLPAVGAVLVVSLLIIPAVAARFWTDRLGTMLLIAGAFGLISGVLGTLASAYIPAPAGSAGRGWPTGPMITLAAAALFIASLLFAPRRGLIANFVRRIGFQKRIALQNFLRAIFEHQEQIGKDVGAPWSPKEIRRWKTGKGREKMLRLALRLGLTNPAGEGQYILSPRGMEDATRIVRAHRLWELYLIEQADIAPDHVDRDADTLEHVLSPELVSQLESKLAEMGKLPGAEVRSPHAIGKG